MDTEATNTEVPAPDSDEEELNIIRSTYEPAPAPEPIQPYYILEDGQQLPGLWLQIYFIFTLILVTIHYKILDQIIFGMQLV